MTRSAALTTRWRRVRAQSMALALCVLICAATQLAAQPPDDSNGTSPAGGPPAAESVPPLSQPAESRAPDPAPPTSSTPEASTPEVSDPSAAPAESAGSESAALQSAPDATAGNEPINPDAPPELLGELEAVADGSLTLRAADMPAYWGLFRSIQGHTPQQLEAAARKVSFHELMHHPHRYRGQLITVELTIRRVTGFDAPPNNPAGLKRLYEVWGWPTTNSGWLYVGVLPELPSGMPADVEQGVYVRLTGRFLKLQAYQPADAKPNAKPLQAPLILGVIQMTAAPPGPSKRFEFYFGAQMLVLAFFAFGAVRLMILMRVRLSRADRQQRLSQLPKVDEERELTPEHAEAFDWVVPESRFSPADDSQSPDKATE